MSETVEKNIKAEDAEKLKGICDLHAKDKGSVITILQELQEHFGYVPEEAVNFIADRLEIPKSHFYGVATFYSQFHFKPRGKNIITACCGTACHVKGSERLINILGRELGIPEGQETSEDMNFTLERVNCVGACSIAPVIVINKEVHGKMSTEGITKAVRKLKGGTDGK